MKKTIITLVLALFTIISTSAFIKLTTTGIAGSTGSPGESHCNSCHGGASSASFGTTITSVPSFTADEFVPSTLYQITVQFSATGFTKFGFGCEILDALNNNSNAGIMQSPGAGVHFLNAFINPTQRRDATHTTPKNTVGGVASFSFGWLAPAQGAGDTATIFVAGNAVNGNGSTNGDFPLPPVFMQLRAHRPDSIVDTTTVPNALRKINLNSISEISVFPNPASKLTSINYFLSQTQNVSVQLISMNGKVIKEFINETQSPGSHAHLLDLQNVTSGVYFVKTSINDQKVSQKLIAVQ